LYFEKTCFAGKYPETREMHKTKEKAQSRKHIFRNMEGKETEKPTFTRHLGRETTTGEA
jgi:hypothetical protein